MNKSRNSVIKLDTRSIYRIKIQGKLNSDWVTNMCDMMVGYEDGEDQSVVTMLTGELIDQAALLGLLNSVYNLGYPLLSLAYLGRADHPTPMHG